MSTEGAGDSAAVARNIPAGLPTLQRGVPPGAQVAAVSPPSKRDLQSWWKKFRKGDNKPDEKVEIPTGIFGVPLAVSIRYANVAISLQNENGESFIYGYVPIVVAKCGVFLKERATDVEGIFRLNGSAKRIKDLQTAFNSPEKYGKGLDWTGYTVHDAANILRRYLNQLPEPIVPLEFYELFRDPLRSARVPTQNDGGDPQPIDMTMDAHNAAVVAYQKLITVLPPLNRQLLLYILDLLAVFASKSDLNLMTAANLAAIFQPGILSHPSHDMHPNEYRLSQDVLIFLIENQDNFLIGMSGTAVDERTKSEVESGAPSIKSPKALGRSASNASAGADSLRKYGVRRNVSVSSRGSRERASPGVSGPGTPTSAANFGAGAGGLARSNTVPTKRSPAIGSSRFQKMENSSDSPSPVAPTSAGTETIGTPTTPARNVGMGPNNTVADHENIVEEGQGKVETGPAPVPVLSAPPIRAYGEAVQQQQQQQHQNQQYPPQQLYEQQLEQQQPQQLGQQPTVPLVQPQQAFPVGQLEPQHPQEAGLYAQTTPTPPNGRERKISGLFSKPPIFGPSDPNRPTKRLQKKPKLPGSANESAQSSVNSLQGAEDHVIFHTPLASPEITNALRTDPLALPTGPAVTNTAATPVAETPTQVNFATPPVHDDDLNYLKPVSPPGSTRSRSSFTDHSELENNMEAVVQPEKEKEKRHRWRFSSSAKKPDNSVLVPPPVIGQNTGAGGSNSSLGSRPRKSFTGDSQSTIPPHLEPSGTGMQSLVGHTNSELSDQGQAEPERKGLFGKLKKKMAGGSRDERYAEKERAKSPPWAEPGASLLAVRGRSFDRRREEDNLEAIAERSVIEANQVRRGSVDGKPDRPAC